MKKTNSTRAGSEAQYGPRLAGAVLHDYLENSNDPLAVAFRDRLYKDFFPDTHLGVDLKLITREPGRMHVGAYLDGMITRDDDYHFTFVQNDLGLKKLGVTRRHPHVYVGKYITITRWDDGSLHPNFKAVTFGKDFNLMSYAYGVAYELREALGGLLEIDS